MITTVLCLQLFLAGLPLVWIALLGMAGAVGLIGTYLVLPHVAARIDGFLDPAAGDRYQIERSMDAFMNGGLFGTGPGEGHGQAASARRPFRLHLRGSPARSSDWSRV